MAAEIRGGVLFPGSTVVPMYEAEMRNAYDRAYGDVYPEFAARLYDMGAKSVKAPFDFLRRWAERALEFVRTRPMDRRIVEVQQETIDQVHAFVEQSLEEGLKPDEIADMIEENWNDPLSGVNRMRAERIARTEMISGANAGTRDGAVFLQDQGIETQHFWISAFDNRVREEHDTRLHPELAEPRSINEPYIVGGEELMHPGDPNGSPWNVIQCRCVEGFEFPD